jgi:hypothetical protein
VHDIDFTQSTNSPGRHFRSRFCHLLRCSSRSVSFVSVASVTSTFHGSRRCPVSLHSLSFFRSCPSKVEELVGNRVAINLVFLTVLSSLPQTLLASPSVPPSCTTLSRPQSYIALQSSHALKSRRRTWTTHASSHPQSCPLFERLPSTSILI